MYGRPRYRAAIVLSVLGIMGDDKLNILSVSGITIDDRSKDLRVLGSMTDDKSKVLSLLGDVTGDKSNVLSFLGGVTDDRSSQFSDILVHGHRESTSRGVKYMIRLDLYNDTVYYITYTR